jgi:DNA modification methylase
VDGQIGAEKSPAEYVERLRILFAEVRRVLADDGTCWLNLGDSYMTSPAGNKTPSGFQQKSSAGTSGAHDAQMAGKHVARNFGVPAKNLLGIPWRVAFALQDDGWVLRNAVVWHKPNAMPESVTDRLSTRYEMVFMLAKSRRYSFDLDPIRETHTIDPHRGARPWDTDNPLRKLGNGDGTSNGKGAHPTGTSAGDLGFNPAGKNPGDVWTIPTVPFGGAHFAAYPAALVERCIMSGCKPGGTVLDPFSGSGTTGMVALKHGRKYVGIELNAEYLDLSLRTRLHTGVLDFGSAS